MQLKTKDGIECDVCGMQFRDQFSYYSSEGVGYTYDVARGLKTKNGLYLDLDICESCKRNYESEILKNVDKAKEGHIKDDFSKEYFRKTVYMQIILTKVSVKVADDNESNGVLNSEQDIDFIVAGDSLKKFLKKVTEIRNLRKAKPEEEEWTMK